MINSHDEGWVQSDPQVFWGEIAPCNHLVQIYETDEIFMDSLEEFVCSGLNTGDNVVLIATGPHLNALTERLVNFGFNVDRIKDENRLIVLSAEETLARFMRNGWPDEKLFYDTVKEVIGQAKQADRRIRAFGEMVAVLWSQGHNGATVRLEHLWNEFCKSEAFSLFCAYPKSGFTQDANTSLLEICSAHSKVLGGWKKPVMEIFYKHSGHSAA